MKNANTLFFWLFSLSSFSQANLIEKSTCIDGKRNTYQIPTRGILVYVYCKEKGGKSFDIFIMKENLQAENGEMINENYEMVRGRKKIESIGPDFFVTSVRGQDFRYKYDFRTKSWTKIEKKPPTWSTGQRE